MNCRVCKKKSQHIFDGKIINKYDIKYYYCTYCGYLQTEDPYWIEEVYKDSVNISDTGILARNVEFSRKTAVLLYFFFNKNSLFLDYAGGYGIYVRLMRDIGYNFYWHDLYTNNLFARGYELNKSSGKVELVTSFESFEHFVHPIREIENILKISRNILFSVNVLPDTIPKPNDWWYYGLEHGQHLSFYSRVTLKFISKEFKLNLYRISSNLYLMTDNKFNELLMQILVKLFKGHMFNVISRKIKSKTIEDMQSFPM